MTLEETNRYPASEKPGEAGLYKRFSKNPNTDAEVVHYCLFEDGWWYEGSVELTSALNHPLRKSHFQDEGFEWCGVMPGSYERADVAEVKTANFVGGFFGVDSVAVGHHDSSYGKLGSQAELNLDDVKDSMTQSDQSFASGFFGEAPV